MYFDLKPKARREDLYDRERELEDLMRALVSGKYPLTVVTGIRRLGKTSLLLVAFSEVPGVLVDLRGVGQSRATLYRRLSSAINRFAEERAGLWERVMQGLRRVSGVQVSGFGVSLSWGERRADLVELLSGLAEYGVAVAFDEAQSLRGTLKREFAEILAYVYDHVDVKVVLTGSEVGVLYDFIGVEDPEAPLYGRDFHEIRLSRFDHERSLDFLRKGFEQEGLEVDDEVLEYACRKLNGIVGWLVTFGVRCVERGARKEVVDEVLEEASRLVAAEFEKFLESHKPAESRILACAKAIADGENTWSRIKRRLEDAERGEIADPVLHRALRALVKASYVERIVEGRNVYYKIADPVLAHALRGGKGGKPSHHRY